MFISKISIQNFRSIKKLVIDPSNLCALIGPNSTGKTNVLKAIDLVLGEGWTTKAKVARELFCDPAQPIEIEIEFSSPIEFTKKNGHPGSVSSIKLEMSLEPDLAVTTTINEGEKFWDQEQFKKACHFVLIPSERNLEDELRVSQWTMLGKLMKLIYENYIQYHSGNESKLREAFAKEIQPAKNFLEDDFSDDVTFRKFSDAFTRNCLANSGGFANGFEPVLNIYNLNWFYKTLQIHVREQFPERCFDSNEVGSGMKNLLLISIFQTYAELMGRNVIFGIEEPEIYLYPQAQRSLYKSFISLSSATQIFYTTHNPNFVDAARPDDIILLRKTESAGTQPTEKLPFFTSSNAEKEKYKIYTQFNQDRNEIFFAKKVLLVEGDSDKILFSTLCETRWDIDIDKNGISIISCGGKNGVLYFIGVCKLVGLSDYFAVWDEDGECDKQSELAAVAYDSKGLELVPDLEGFLKISKGKDDKKIENAHKWACSPTSSIPQELDRVKEFLMSEKQDDIAPDVWNDEIRIEDIPF